jgi:hypothetical protein
VSPQGVTEAIGSRSASTVEAVGVTQGVTETIGVAARRVTEAIGSRFASTVQAGDRRKAAVETIGRRKA